MAQLGAVGVDGRGRTRSLRREWSRAFTIMLVLLLVATIATFAGVRLLVGQFSGTARRLDRESTILATLRTSLTDHETTAHNLLGGAVVDRQAFLHQQDDISRAFGQAMRIFPVGKNTTEVLGQAEESWQAAMTTAGLWGDQVTAFQGTHDDVQLAFGVASAKARALLDGLEEPALEAMRRSLMNDAALERLVMVSRAALFGLAVAVTLYFRRRMTRDLVGPIASMRQSVLRLQAGEYDHRIEVVRHDELGDLAEAFNTMAAALHDSHLALTLRATHDSLTGLANRSSLAELLNVSFGPNNDRRARQESVLFIDIDDFKDVNDSMGDEAGDALLIQLAGRLKDCVRPQDVVARLGGDEFAILVKEDSGGTGAVVIAERILDALRSPFIIGGARLRP
jgi:diguanylate cyclase (GGDEF)-like protein